MSGSLKLGEIVKLAGGYMMERVNLHNFHIKCMFYWNNYIYALYDRINKNHFHFFSKKIF